MSKSLYEFSWHTGGISRVLQTQFIAIIFPSMQRVKTIDWSMFEWTFFLHLYTRFDSIWWWDWCGCVLARHIFLLGWLHFPLIKHARDISFLPRSESSWLDFPFQEHARDISVLPGWAVGCIFHCYIILVREIAANPCFSLLNVSGM